MRNGRLAILAAMALRLACASAGETFEMGVKAMASKDFPSAFGYMESAIKQDPDNLRYASEYRMAVIAAAKQLHPKEGKPTITIAVSSSSSV